MLFEHDADKKYDLFPISVSIFTHALALRANNLFLIIFALGASQYPQLCGNFEICNKMPLLSVKIDVSYSQGIDMDNKQVHFLLLMIIFIFSFSTSAAGNPLPLTGSVMYTDCKKKLDDSANVPLSNNEKYQAGFCNGMMKGIDDMQDLFMDNYKKFTRTSNVEFYCIPPGTPINEMASNYIKYMDKHPELMNLLVGSSIMPALRDAYPYSQ